jgi:hypothetical protein
MTSCGCLFLLAGNGNRTAEDRRLAANGRRVTQVGLDRRPAGVVASVATSQGDAATEQQLAAIVVQNGLAGGLRVESSRFDSIRVANDMNTGHRGGRFTQVCLIPTFAGSGRLEENDPRVTEPWKRATTFSSSPRLARVQGQRG